jgi:hypothetical protein
MESPMAKRKKVEPVDELEQVYEDLMAEVYDILMEAYDKVGVAVKDAIEQATDAELGEDLDIDLDDDTDDDVDY